MPDPTRGNGPSPRRTTIVRKWFRSVVKKHSGVWTDTPSVYRPRWGHRARRVAVRASVLAALAGKFCGHSSRTKTPAWNIAGPRRERRVPRIVASEFRPRGRGRKGKCNVTTMISRGLSVPASLGVPELKLCCLFLFGNRHNSWFILVPEKYRAWWWINRCGVPCNGPSSSPLLCPVSGCAQDPAEPGLGGKKSPVRRGAGAVLRSVPDDDARCTRPGTAVARPAGSPGRPGSRGPV